MEELNIEFLPKRLYRVLCYSFHNAVSYLKVISNEFANNQTSLSYFKLAIRNFKVYNKEFMSIRPNFLIDDNEALVASCKKLIEMESLDLESDEFDDFCYRIVDYARSLSKISYKLSICIEWKVRSNGA